MSTQAPRRGPGPKRIPFPSLTTSTDVNADLSASTTTVIMTQTDTSIITQIVSSENSDRRTIEILSATLGSGVFMFAAYIAWRLLKKLKLRKKLPKVLGGATTRSLASTTTLIPFLGVQSPQRARDKCAQIFFGVRRSVETSVSVAGGEGQPVDVAEEARALPAPPSDGGRTSPNLTSARATVDSLETLPSYHSRL
ncbi:hypothetical protein PTI98_004273 [Pleurotus ostreatus]|nr:hypothetical protein PTI98_004273 [Pleurotus ostreatus]